MLCLHSADSACVLARLCVCVCAEMSVDHDHSDQAKQVAQSCPVTVAYMIERRLLQAGHERFTLCVKCGKLAYLHRVAPTGVSLSSLPSLSSSSSSPAIHSAPVPSSSSISLSAHKSDSSSKRKKKRKYEADESYTDHDREYDEDARGDSTPELERDEQEEYDDEFLSSSEGDGEEGEEIGSDNSSDSEEEEEEQDEEGGSANSSPRSPSPSPRPSTLSSPSLSSSSSSPLSTSTHARVDVNRSNALPTHECGRDASHDHSNQRRDADRDRSESADPHLCHDDDKVINGRKEKGKKRDSGDSLVSQGQGGGKQQKQSMKDRRVTDQTKERHKADQRRPPPAPAHDDDDVVSSSSTSKGTHGRDERAEKSKKKKKPEALATSCRSPSPLSSGRHETKDRHGEMAASSSSSRSAVDKQASSTGSAASAEEQRCKVQRQHEVQASRTTVRHELSEVDSYVPPHQPLPVQEVVYVRHGVARPVSLTAGRRRPPRRVLQGREASYVFIHSEAGEVQSSDELPPGFVLKPEEYKVVDRNHGDRVVTGLELRALVFCMEKRVLPAERLMVKQLYRQFVGKRRQLARLELERSLSFLRVNGVDTFPFRWVEADEKRVAQLNAISHNCVELYRAIEVLSRDMNSRPWCVADCPLVKQIKREVKAEADENMSDGDESDSDIPVLVDFPSVPAPVASLTTSVPAPLPARSPRAIASTSYVLPHHDDEQVIKTRKAKDRLHAMGRIWTGATKRNDLTSDLRALIEMCPAHKQDMHRYPKEAIMNASLPSGKTVALCQFCLLPFSMHPMLRACSQFVAGYAKEKCGTCGCGQSSHKLTLPPLPDAHSAASLSAGGGSEVVDEMDENENEGGTDDEGNDEASEPQVAVDSGSVDAEQPAADECGTTAPACLSSPRDYEDESGLEGVTDTSSTCTDDEESGPEGMPRALPAYNSVSATDDEQPGLQLSACVHTEDTVDVCESDTTTDDDDDDEPGCAPQVLISEGVMHGEMMHVDFMESPSSADCQLTAVSLLRAGMAVCVVCNRRVDAHAQSAAASAFPSSAAALPPRVSESRKVIGKKDLPLFKDPNNAEMREPRVFLRALKRVFDANSVDPSMWETLLVLAMPTDAEQTWVEANLKDKFLMWKQVCDLFIAEYEDKGRRDRIMKQLENRTAGKSERVQKYMHDMMRLATEANVSHEDAFVVSLAERGLPQAVRQQLRQIRGSRADTINLLATMHSDDQEFSEKLKRAAEQTDYASLSLLTQAAVAAEKTIADAGARNQPAPTHTARSRRSKSKRKHGADSADDEEDEPAPKARKLEAAPGGPTNVGKKHKGGAKKQHKGGQKGKPKPMVKRDHSTNECYTCHKTGHHSDDCFQNRTKCVLCGEAGHLKKECSKYRPPRSRALCVPRAMSASCVRREVGSRLIVTSPLLNDYVLADVTADSGAEFSAISRNLVERYNLKVVRPPHDEPQKLGGVTEDMAVNRVGFVSLPVTVHFPLHSSKSSISFTKKFEVMDLAGTEDMLVGIEAFDLLFPEVDLAGCAAVKSVITDAPHHVVRHTQSLRPADEVVQASVGARSAAARRVTVEDEVEAEVSDGGWDETVEEAHTGPRVRAASAPSAQTD